MSAGNGDFDFQYQNHVVEDEFDDEYEEEEYEEEYSFDLPTIPFISQAGRRHKALSKLLRLRNYDQDNDSVSKLFITIATIVDPMTQPMESDTHVLSLSLISDLIIGLSYDKDSIVPVFSLSSNLFKIIESSINVLNCSDEVKLRSLNNSDIKVDWRMKLSEWTPPQSLRESDINLIYMINCACIFTIYKLYQRENKDVCLNPFLGYFLKLWKIFTNLVLLGLEIDRRIESDPAVTTPSIVKLVIRGSSAIRYVLASILNDEIYNRYHDFFHVNIMHFLSPFARELGSGCLNADVRWYVGAMLALGSDLNEVVETLIDLEPNDRYDEDVKYMFDYEYENFHYEEMFQDEEDEYDEEFKNGGSIVYEDEEGHLHRVVRKRCDCTFFIDEGNNWANQDEDGQEPPFDEFRNQQIKDFGTQKAPTAVRSDEKLEFDEFGRDWRDIPRGGNIFFNTEVKLDDSTCLSWDELSDAFDRLSQGPMNDKEWAQKVIFTIARAVKMEFEQDINKSVMGKKEESEDSITPDKIYEKWSHDWVFEEILIYNQNVAYAMLDEMMMAHGYRRVIIWFITHLPLSFQLLVYIYELLTGTRGENTEKTYKFSRQGSLELSEIEKSMVLHEFLNTCFIDLSKHTGSENIEDENPEFQNAGDFQRNIKMIRMICLLIDKLTDSGKIELEEYRLEITALFINWIGHVSDARRIFFSLNKSEGAQKWNSDQDIPEREHGKEPEIQVKPTAKRIKKFNPELKVLLSNVLKKISDNNKTGDLLFQPFFELIDHDNDHKTAKDDLTTEGDSQIEAPDPFAGDDGGSMSDHYIRGVIVPLVRSEEYEHAKIEQAINR